MLSTYDLIAMNLQRANNLWLLRHADRSQTQISVFYLFFPILDSAACQFSE